LSLDVAQIAEDYPPLCSTPVPYTHGITAYRIQLPDLPEDRAFEWAELILQSGFPQHGLAKIRLSTDAILRVPHVDGDGVLCVEGDPGPESGLSPEERVYFLLEDFEYRFLIPWMKGRLDGNFEIEPLNYWLVKVGRARSTRDPVRSVWTVDVPPDEPRVREGRLLLPGRIAVAAGDDLSITARLERSLGARAKQRHNLLVADIPIAHTFTPSTWPGTTPDLERILENRLSTDQKKQFQSFRRRRNRRVHRIVLLRNMTCAFAYLLPGGPPTRVDNGRIQHTYPSRTKPLPLRVTRIDPSWIVGRDQYPEVKNRQLSHVLVLGAGALGSPVVDHLAKAGVGTITLVDPDDIEPANIGRHLLGAQSIDKRKAKAVSQRINLEYPSTVVYPVSTGAERWLKENGLSKISMIVDLTGEPSVRWHVEQARKEQNCPLLVGWMEPYVAAAHVCFLRPEDVWLQGGNDPMKGLQAVDWPDEVIQREPGCSSRFQAYNSAAAAHAVALISEKALQVLDSPPDSPETTSWVRGQHYLDRHWPGLQLKAWALAAAPHDGLIISRPFP